MAQETRKNGTYWRKNTALITILLVIWFTVSYLFGIILANQLSTIHIGELPLGFWFAQQGSIYIFVALIFIYAKKMGEIDRKFDVHE